MRDLRHRVPSPFRPSAGFLPIAFGLLVLFLAPGLLGGQGFGEAVAVGDGEVLVGEPLNELHPGAVYVYRRGGEGRWAERAALAASDAEDGDRFGRAIALLNDALLVGATARDESRGAAYVFRRDASGNWRQVQKVRPDDLSSGDAFGRVAAADGNIALVATWGQAEGRGAVYVLHREPASGRWSVGQKLVAGDGRGGDLFGTGLAVRGDLAVVGAAGHRNGAGAIYVFLRDPETGDWAQEAKLSPQDSERNHRFGTAVALHGDRILVGAPGFAGGSGAVYLFERDAEAGEWRETGRLLPFDDPPFAQFGSSVLFDGSEAWIAAPLAHGSRGAIYRIRWDEAEDRWTDATLLSAAGSERGDRFGSAADRRGDVAVVALGGADYGAGRVGILERAEDGWREASRVWSEVEGLPAVVGGKVECAGGSAVVFDCRRVDLLSFLPVRRMGGGRGVRVNDVWGWTDPKTGREYALVGRLDGTAFVDVTDPENPAYLGDLPKTEGSPGSTWRDIKVYRDHAFIVADGALDHGMQVFDLTRLRDAGSSPVTFAPDAHYNRIHSAHNIVINEETGFAYSVGNSAGGETCGGGLHMIDIRDPKNPTFAGCFAHEGTGRQRTGYTHDAQCVVYRGPDERYRGREICFGANETALSIADVTDKENPVALAVASYPNVGYAHQGWLTEDHRYFLMNDELDEIQGTVDRTRTLIWDVEDLEDPVLAKEFFGETRATDHNLYIRGDLMYQSNYRAGLRIIDISDVLNPKEVAYFDTVPYGETEPGFGGSWSNYPFFESGVIIVTSGSEGLFVLRKREFERASAGTAKAVPQEAGGGLLYVCNQAGAAVSVIDMGTNEVVHTVDLRALGFSPTAQPHHIAVEPDGSFWYVSLIGDSKVLKFDAQNRLVGQAETEAPGLLALDPVSDRLYVARSMTAVNAPPTIGVIRRSDMAIEEVEVFVPRPHALILGPEGRYLYTASVSENRIAVLDAETGRLSLVDVEGPHHSFVQFALSPGGRTLVVTGEMSHRLLAFDLADPSAPRLVRSLEVAPVPWDPVFSPDGRLVYLGNQLADAVTVVDAEAWEVVELIRGEGLAEPHASALSADGRWLYISNRNLRGGYAPAAGEGEARGKPAREAGTPGATPAPASPSPGTVVVIDTETREIAKVIEVGPYASGMSTGPASPAPPARR